MSTQSFYLANLLIAFLLFQFVNVPIFSFINGTFKTKNFLNLKSSWRHVFIKSYTQIFIMRICFNKLFQICKWEQKHRAPATYHYINNDCAMLTSLL